MPDAMRAKTLHMYGAGTVRLQQRDVLLRVLAAQKRRSQGHQRLSLSFGKDH
jgi:hypothetical protein